MKEIDELLKDIEELRNNLMKLIDDKEGNLLDRDVITASKLLNTVIAEYNKLIGEKL